MKIHKQKAALWVAALTLLGGLPLQGQMMKGPMHEGGDGEAMMERMHQHMGEMRERMSEMRQQMQRMDQKLEKQLKAVEEAEGDAKIGAMEEVIRTLVEQRTAMNEQRAQMMERMMNQMDGGGMMGSEYGERPDRGPQQDSGSKSAPEEAGDETHHPD